MFFFIAHYTAQDILLKQCQCDIMSHRLRRHTTSSGLASLGILHLAPPSGATISSIQKSWNILHLVAPLRGAPPK